MGRKFTEEDTKAYLRSIWDFTLTNRAELEKIAELRAIAESCTVRTDKESVQTSGSGDKLTNIVGRIVDIEREIYQRNKIIKHRRAEFEEITNEMTDKRQKSFLTVRYFDGNGFYDTALILEMNESTAKRIHRKAITEFTRIFNEKHK